jgi:hypothetical protein
MNNLLLFIAAALAASTPIAAAVLVSIASRREDRDRSLDDPSVGQVQIVARRIVGFHTDNHKRRSLQRVPADQLAASRSRRRPVEPSSRRPAERSSSLMIASR